MSHKKRVIAYIDGFNMYHSIHGKLPDYYKWLNYRSLIASYLAKDEELKKVIFFTAYPVWDREKITRHQNYTKVLSKSCWVDIVLGQYKEKSVIFNLKNHPIITEDKTIIEWFQVDPGKFIFQTYEEKETDVNIAIHIVKWAFQDEYDMAYILSADSDISPAVSMCRMIFPDKWYCFLFPYKKFSITNQDVATKVRKIKISHLEKSLLPDECVVWDEKIHSPYKKSLSEDRD